MGREISPYYGRARHFDDTLALKALALLQHDEVVLELSFPEALILEDRLEIEPARLEGLDPFAASNGRNDGHRHGAGRNRRPEATVDDGTRCATSVHCVRHQAFGGFFWEIGPNPWYGINRHGVRLAEKSNDFHRVLRWWFGLPGA